MTIKVKSKLLLGVWRLATDLIHPGVYLAVVKHRLGKY